jgi:hypothetical protein
VAEQPPASDNLCTPTQQTASPSTATSRTGSSRKRLLCELGKMRLLQPCSTFGGGNQPCSMTCFSLL